MQIQEIVQEEVEYNQNRHADHLWTGFMEMAWSDLQTVSTHDPGWNQLPCSNVIGV